MLETEAGVVRQVFAWVGRDRVSVGEVRPRQDSRRQASDADGPAPVGLLPVVWGILKNPAYAGRAAYGKRDPERAPWSALPPPPSRGERVAQPRKP